MGFCGFDDGAKMDKLEENGRGYDGVDGYPLLGTMMHVGVTNLVQIERTGQHDMMLSALVSSHGGGPGPWCAKPSSRSGLVPNLVPQCVCVCVCKRKSRLRTGEGRGSVAGWLVVPGFLLGRGHWALGRETHLLDS